jgi:anti-anti-sigma regulatory factor
MELAHEVKEGFPTVTVLHVAGRVDSSNYLKLIDKARELFASGTEYLLLDLEACDFISSSGLFALHSIALTAHKFAPPDPEHGWEALRKMATEDREFKEKFKIVHVQPNVLRTLDVAGLLLSFDVYSDMQEALEAFKLIE